jgi:hypothetical protein
MHNAGIVANPEFFFFLRKKPCIKCFLKKKGLDDGINSRNINFIVFIMYTSLSLSPGKYIIIIIIIINNELKGW